MSKIALGVVIGIVLTIIAGGVGVWLGDIESPQDAYERGFDEGRGQKDYGFALGYIQGGFDDIAGFDIRLGADGTLVLAWEADMTSLFLHMAYYDELKQFIDSLTLIYHLRAAADSMVMLLDSTDTMLAVEVDDDVDWDTIPFNEILTDSDFKAKMESLGWLDETSSPMPIIMPDTGGER